MDKNFFGEIENDILWKILVYLLALDISSNRISLQIFKHLSNMMECGLFMLWLEKPSF